MKRIFLAVGCCWVLSAQAVEIEHATLPNGLRIFVVPSDRVPMAAIRLLIPGGRAAEAKGKDGAADLLAAMLADHTAQHDHRAWGAWLDARAIRLGASASAEYWRIAITTLAETLPDALQALAECVLKPGFDQKRFSLLKARMQAAAIKAREEPTRLATEAMLPRLFPDHPYGHIPSGTPQTIPSISISDLRALYQAQFAPKGTVLVVAGKARLAQLKPIIKRYFASWQGVPRLDVQTIPKATPRLEKIDIPAPTTQTLVQFYRLGPARHNRDFFAMLVANEILGGGGFSSLLMRELREAHGLVYGAYSYFEPRFAPGPFVIRLQTKKGQERQAEAIVRKLLVRLVWQGVKEDLVRATTERMAGRFPQQIDSNRERADLVAMVAFYHLPLDYLDRWTERVRSVHAGDVQRVLQRWMPPEGWGIIRVGAKGGAR